MATKSKNVAVKRAGETKPAAATPAPAAGFGWMQPFGDLRKEIEDVFDRFSTGFPGFFPMSPSFRRLWEAEPGREMGAPFSLPQMELAPKVDVAETDAAYEVTAELPGMEEKDLEVSVADGTLTLKGEKKVEREEKKKDYHLTERSYGSFRRTFRVPESVEVDKISAGFAKGVLTVTLPKSKEAQAKSRKIEVKAK